VNPIQLAIKQPITVAVGILLTLLSGYLAFTGVPVEMTPQIEKGVISVTTAYPNALPQDVENDILVPQEDVLRELSGLERMTSTANRGQGQIRIELGLGVDVQAATYEVDQLISRVPGYPDNVLQPVVEAEDPESNDYIAWVVVEREEADGTPIPSADVQEFFDFVENNVAPRLERLEGMSKVNVLGGRERELQVRVDVEALARRGITMSELVAAIQSANADFSGGALAEGDRDVSIRVPARWDSIAEAEQTVIRQDDSGQVFLSDVATVEESYREASSFIRSRGVPVLAMNFQRELGSNVLGVMRRMQAEIEMMNSAGGLLDQFAQSRNLEGTVRLRQVYDETIYVEQAISMVRNNLLIGAALAVVVLLLFLRSIRSVGIVALAIPTSVLAASIAMILLGRTVNVVSLAGAAFAIGLVVDNSIVVLENIYRHLEMQKSPTRAAYDGTKEVALAVLASTLTTVVVFVPVLLIQQQVGQLFRDLGIAICSAVLVSYVVSVLVIPSAAALLLKPQKREDDTGDLRPVRKKSTFEKLNPFSNVPAYFADSIHMINGSWIGRFATVGTAMVLVVIGVVALLPPFDYLPQGNRNIIFGLIIPPPGYNVEKLSEMGEQVEADTSTYYDAGYEVVRGDVSLDEAADNLPSVQAMGPDGEPFEVTPPPLENYFIVGLAGQDTIFHGAISLDDQRVVDIQPLFQKATGDVPGTFAFSFQPPIFRLGGGSGAAVSIDVTGENLEEVQNAAGALFGALRPKVDSVQPKPANFNLQGPQLSVRPDNLRATDVGLTPADVGLTASALGDGIILSDAYQYPDELRDVTIVTAASVGATDGASAIDRLADAPVATPRGSLVSLSEVADIVEAQSPTVIRRVAGEKAVTLEATAAKGVPLATAISDINGTISELRDQGAIPESVRTNVAGTADALSDIQQTLLGDGSILGTLGSSAVIALFIVYLLMCVLFQSWSYPFVIMLTVPLATFGGFVGLWLINFWTGTDRYMPTTNLDVLAMLGFIILSGTVVNNAILIVEQTNNFLRMTPDELDESGIDCHGDKTNDGIGPRRAITEAVRSRVRPIFMSMLTSVGGMLPLVLIPGSGTELYRGLGAVVVGGLFVSTVFTLFVTPAMLSIVMDLKQTLGLRVRPDPEAERFNEGPVVQGVPA
jgi:HAE1 family hydrophobic/amphiphilic exporter-1